MQKDEESIVLVTTVVLFEPWFRSLRHQPRLDRCLAWLYYLGRFRRYSFCNRSHVSPETQIDSLSPPTVTPPVPFPFFSSSSYFSSRSWSSLFFILKYWYSLRSFFLFISSTHLWSSFNQHSPSALAAPSVLLFVPLFKEVPLQPCPPHVPCSASSVHPSPLIRLPLYGNTARDPLVVVIPLQWLMTPLLLPSAVKKVLKWESVCIHCWLPTHSPFTTESGVWFFGVSALSASGSYLERSRDALIF